MWYGVATPVRRPISTILPNDVVEFGFARRFAAAKVSVERGHGVRRIRGQRAADDSADPADSEHCDFHECTSFDSASKRVERAFPLSVYAVFFRGSNRVRTLSGSVREQHAARSREKRAGAARALARALVSSDGF